MAESGAELEKQREQQEGRSKVHCDLHRGKVELKGTVPSEITTLKTVSGTKQVKRPLIAWGLEPQTQKE